MSALDDSLGQRRLLSPGVLFGGVYAIAFLTSKYLGLGAGYAIDDYHLVSQGNSGKFTSFFLSQGRYTNALLDWMLSASNLNMSNFSVVCLIATVIFSALFYTRSLRPIEIQGRFVLIGAAALLGAHSYYTEYVTFRQSALPMSVMFASMWMSIDFYRKALQSPNIGRNLAIALAFGLIAMGANQLAVCFLSIAVLYVHASNSTLTINGSDTGSGIRELILATLAAALAGVVLLGGNLLLSSLARLALGVSADGRAGILPLSELQVRLDQLAALARILIFKDEPVASGFAKITALMGLFLLLVPRNISQIRPLLGALYLLAISFCIVLVPVAASTVWWPTPRTLIAFPFALAAISLIAARVNQGRNNLPAGGLLLLSAFLFSAHSNSMLLNQQRLNRWDMAQAQEIAFRIAERYPDHGTKIAVVGASWHHPLAPGIAQGDMNTSALSIGWAVDALFDETTGSPLDVRSAPELAARCEGRLSFPAPDSTQMIDGEVLVCL